MTVNPAGVTTGDVFHDRKSCWCKFTFKLTAVNVILWSVIAYVPLLDAFLSFGICKDADIPCWLRRDHACTNTNSSCLALVPSKVFAPACNACAFPGGHLHTCTLGESEFNASECVGDTV